MLHAKLAVHFLCQGVDFPCQDGFINYGSCHGNEYIAIKEDEQIGTLADFHFGTSAMVATNLECMPCWLQDTP